MMPRSVQLFLVALTTFIAAIAAAGEIRGILTKGGQPVPGAKIQITTGSATQPSTATDSSGFYRLFIPETVQCTITVVSLTGKDGKHPSTAVNSFDRSIQYDLILDIKDGNYTVTTR